MKLTIEPRKTTWVPFVDSKAQLKVEWRARVEYHAHNARDLLSWPVRSRYTFSGLEGALALPSAQLLLMEDGVPLAITKSVASAVKDRFQSEEVDDPFVVVSDRLASLKKSDLKERKLAKGLLERTWVEVIERSLTVENRTGKPVWLELTLVDHPAEELEFVASEPAPDKSSPPERTFAVALAIDATKQLRVTLKHSRSESIRTPIEPSGPYPTRQAAQAAEYEQLDEQALNEPQSNKIE